MLITTNSTTCTLAAFVLNHKLPFGEWTDDTNGERDLQYGTIKDFWNIEQFLWSKKDRANDSVEHTGKNINRHFIEEEYTCDS